MKRLFVAAGLALAALSLPATTAMADGYEPRPVAKPKPKPQVKRKAPLKHKHHAAPVYRHHEGVRDFGLIYGQRSHASYSLEQFESVETSYSEESDHHRVGPIVSYRERYVNPDRGCYAHAPCEFSTGPQPSAEFHQGGHPGGVGFGVDGGPIYSGEYWRFGHGAARGYYGGHGYGRPGHAFPPGYGHPGYPRPKTHPGGTGTGHPNR